MKAAQLRALIGKRVEWEYAHDRNRGTCLVGGGIIKDVKGKNVLIDSYGSLDWKWVPHMINLREAQERTA